MAIQIIAENVKMRSSEHQVENLPEVMGLSAVGY